MKAARIFSNGGPEVFQIVTIDKPVPKPDEALIKLRVAGLNFIDIYQRTGFYKVELPAILGTDGAGIVEALGDKVDPGLGVKIGDRVAVYSRGTYCQYVTCPADKLVPIPEGVSDEIATAAMVQGLTAHYLLHSSYATKKGDFVLIHAAAGGTGQFLVQIALLLGAQVIGTTSSPEKIALIKELGVQHAINYKEQDIEKEVLRITNGKGVQCVCDGVGKSTWETSLKCAAIRSTVIYFGNASGPIPPIDPLLLMPKSVYLIRPTLSNYTRTREELLGRANDIFKWLKEGKLKTKIYKEFPLEEVGKAHTELHSSTATGKIILRV